ncbi:MAG: hypothetical protein HQL58_02305 [Magnetococcales bacterium]|nr:hypothetical protein [Magnetococcales bacterium]
MSDKMAVPVKLNLGCGGKSFIDCINVDINPRWNPDIAVDMSDPELLSRSFMTQRFGSFQFTRDSLTEIVAYDILEHVVHLVPLMTNCLNLLQEGGLFRISVPYDLSLGAWQDPTHVRGFNEQSWTYFTTLYAYLGWNEACFDPAEKYMIMSAWGQTLQASGQMSQEEIIRQPRAIDSMIVMLRKRYLTATEKEQVGIETRTRFVY